MCTYNYILMHILTQISSFLLVTEIFWAPSQQQRYFSSSSPKQALFRATLFCFRANLLYFTVLKKELLNRLSGFKFGWSIAMILYIARTHEFQIAHIPIWTSVSDVVMKSCTSARVTYPPSSPVPHWGKGV